MSNIITLQQLKTFLLDAAVIFRGNMDVSEFKNYIFGILFIKRLSDSFDEARAKLIEFNLDQGSWESHRRSDPGKRERFRSGRYLCIRVRQEPVHC